MRSQQRAGPAFYLAVAPGAALANEVETTLSKILFYALVHAVFILGRRFADRLRKNREIVIIIERHEDYAARPRGGHLRAVWSTLRITSDCRRRTKAALQAAKARGKRLGNPRLSEAAALGTAAGKAAADQRAARVLPIIREDAGQWRGQCQWHCRQAQ
jgi:hypothetical protein